MIHRLNWQFWLAPRNRCSLGACLQKLRESRLWRCQSGVQEITRAIWDHDYGQSVHRIAAARLLLRFRRGVVKRWRGGVAARGEGIVRQLYDFKYGTRAGVGSALMRASVEKLAVEDMLALAAYAGS